MESATVLIWILGVALILVVSVMLNAIYQEMKAVRIAIEKLGELANDDHHREGSLANLAWIFNRLTKALNDYIEHQWHSTH